MSPVETQVRQAAAAKGNDAFRDRTRRAEMLRAIAARLRARRDEVMAAGVAETSLTGEELAPEFERMVGTLGLFADLITEGSWVRATIDHRPKISAGSIGPAHELRRMLVPLPGVVAVFGASNFPLAYGVCGGDTASALAAGCPVVVKEHPAHPRTGRLIARIARGAIESAGLPADLLGYAEDDESNAFAVARELVEHSMVVAVGFTGSLAGGLALEKAAHSRARPVPVFAEMGSANPVFITAGALAERAKEIGRELAASLLSRHGQQCTCPGLFLPDSSTDAWLPLREELAAAVARAPARAMLSRRTRSNYMDRVAAVGGHIPEVHELARGTPGDDPALAPPVLFETDWDELRRLGFISEEIFGPGGVLVPVNLADEGAVGDVLERIGSHLTASVYIAARGPEPDSTRRLLDRLRECAGRLIINGPPTGVRVCTSTVHGGPYPATNRPDTTAVGPLAIERWCRPFCWQNCPDHLLPPELREANPLRIRRAVDGAPV